MNIEYIGHSGVLVELDNINLLFDCIAPVTGYDYVKDHDTGYMPKLDSDKQTVVFASHSHGDHYKEYIWQLRSIIKNIDFVISKDIPFSSGIRQRLGITDENTSVTILKNHKIIDLNLSSGDSIRIQSIPATDQGVAYLVMAEDKIIFHSGDHHMWLWDEEGEKYVTNMAKAFRASLAHLEIPENRAIDVAFLLLDPRLGNRAFEGMDACLEEFKIKNIIPIHQWKHFDITDEYIKHRRGNYLDLERARVKSLIGDTTIYKVTGENCRFNIL